MKTITTSLFMFLFSVTFCIAQTTPAILREWAVTAGNTDSLFGSPVLTDDSYTYVATVVVNVSTGPDIRIVKYNEGGDRVWSTDWSGAGNARDQAASMVMDSLYLYICGATYMSSTNDYDYVTMCLKKSDGNISWVKTFNGSASSYDVATAIVEEDSVVFVTGVANNSGTSLDYHTICYKKEQGDLLWEQEFDYNSFMDIPFALTLKSSDEIVVTGGSQSNITDWDYQDVQYNHQGTQTYANRVSGTSAGFDRAQAITSDSAGNIYITGGLRDGGGFDIGTVKFNASGTYQWQNTYSNGPNSLGNDLIVDHDGNVYVCGESAQSGTDFFVEKIKSGGNDDWDVDLDAMGNNDTARAMCFDSYGNIIVTGQSFDSESGNYDFLTIAFDSSGSELWRDLYNGPGNGDDNATNIVADANGNIFVTGQVTTDTGQATVTIKYRTDYFTQPPSLDTPSVAYHFYTNSGQIVDLNDSNITDSVHYYTAHHYPKLYFGYGLMNMIWSSAIPDTATNDSLQRVDVTFLNSSNPTEAYPVDENDSTGYLNYYLPQCPNGITNVHGYGSLLFTDVYPGINAIYSSNEAGLKLSFICSSESDISSIGLAFAGQTDLTVSQNWQLNIHTLFGDYSFEKPHVYQIDGSNNRIALNWAPSWNIPASGEANFVGIQSYDPTKTLVFEISRIANTVNPMPPNADWGTYLGVNASDDMILDNTVDPSHNYAVCGFTRNNGFPGSTGINVFQDSLHGDRDAFVTKFLPNQTLLWSTYYGGSIYAPTNYFLNEDIPFGITATKDGNFIFVGFTTSSDFPLPSSNPVSGGYFQDTLNGEADGFIVELNPDGSRAWASLFGGNTIDNIHAVIQPYNTDYFLICGSTEGHTEDPQPPQGPLGPIVYYEIRDSCFSSINHANLFYSGLPLCNSGGGYFDDNFTHGIPRKGFLAKFGLYDKELKHSTLFGGTGESYLQDLKFDSHNNLLVIGRTAATTTSQTCTVPSSGELPLCNTVGGYFQTVDSSSGYCGILAEFDPNFNLKWSTFFGGCDDIVPTHLAVNKHNEMYVTGYMGSANNTVTSNQCVATNSCSFPLCHDTTEYFRDHFDHFGNTNVNVGEEIFVTRFDTSKNITWSTFYGGSGDDYNQSPALYNTEANADISIDTSGNIYIFSTSKHTVSGGTGDVDLATKPGLYLDNQNASPFIAKRDAILASFGTNNKLYWATYIGGDGNEYGTAVCVDGDYLYVAGMGDNPTGVVDTMTIGSDITGTPYVQGHSNNTSYLDGFIWRFDLSVVLSAVNEIPKNHLNVIVYPNPSTGLITIDFGNSKIDNSSTIEVTDLLGKTVLYKHVDLTEKKNIIDLSFLPNSIYNIRIFDKSISWSSKVVILK